MSKKPINHADQALFRQTVGTVQAVKSDNLALNNSKKPRPVPKPDTQDMEEKLHEQPYQEYEATGFGDIVNYLAPGMQKNVLKKIRKGYFGIDAELDLHGLSSQAAKHQLLQFLHYCHNNGLRCVHIIHGKGYRSPNNIPILKNDVNIWLRQHSDVLAFCSAAPKDGGTGAMMVLLQLSSKYKQQNDTEY